jgi:hypothetical protein
MQSCQIRKSLLQQLVMFSIWFSYTGYRRVASIGFVSFGSWKMIPKDRLTIRNFPGSPKGSLLTVIGNNWSNG